MVPRMEATAKNRAVLDQFALKPVSGVATGGVACVCSSPMTFGRIVDGCAMDGCVVAGCVVAGFLVAGLWCLTTARFLRGGREIRGLAGATLAGLGV